MKGTFCAIAILLGCATAHAGTLSGIVRDATNSGVPNAHVTIHWDPTGSPNPMADGKARQDISVTTDKNGKFSVVLPSGYYDIFVSAPAFDPQCEKLHVNDHGTKRFEVRLLLSRITMKEMD